MAERRKKIKRAAARGGVVVATLSAYHVAQMGQYGKRYIDGFVEGHRAGMKWTRQRGRHESRVL